MLNITLAWILLYIAIGLALIIYVEVESPLWKVILYYGGVILFWPIVILIFIVAIISSIFVHLKKHKK
jgi:hypothetical protein